MYYNKLITILILLYISTFAQSQELTLQGRVIDDESGTPLTGAHVSLLNSGLGAVADYEGYYRIRKVIPGDYTLQVSYIGYEKQTLEITVPDMATEAIDFSLKPGTYQAEQAVITGNRIDVARNMTPISVTVLERESIEKSGESNVLPVISNQVPGIFVTERGITGFGVAAGSAGKISIRGIGGSPNSRVLVLIDGHPQFMGIFGHPLPDAYVASDAEKIEAVRGPASLLYGSNAMGGVINIITRVQTEGLSVNARAAYGSFNTQKYNAAAGYRDKKLQVYGSFNHDQTDGHRENADFQINNGYFKVGYNLLRNFRLSGDLSLADYESTDPGPIDSKDSTYITNPHWQHIKRGYGSASLENNFGKSEGALKFYYNWGKHKLYDGFQSNDRNYGIMVFQALELFKGNTITLGADHVKYGGRAENSFAMPVFTFLDTTIRETGVYAIVYQRFADNILITGGVRAHFHQIYGMKWIPQAGLSLVLKHITMKLNAAGGFRSPTVQEYFFLTPNPGYQPANPGLNPEEMMSYEASFLGRMLNDRISVEVTGYYSQGKNLIETSGIAPDIKYRNVGAFNYFGIETVMQFVISKCLDLNMNYSWLHTDQSILAAPEHQFFGSFTYFNKGFTANLSLQYVGDLYTQVEPAVLGSYMLLNVHLSYVFKRFIAISINGQNLLNEKYEINYGYPMPGVNIMAGLSFKFSTKSSTNE